MTIFLTVLAWGALEPRVFARQGDQNFFNLYKPASLGFSLQRSRGADGREILTLIDHEGGTKLKTAYSRSGQIEQFQWIDSNGAVIEAFELQPVGVARREVFRPMHRLSHESFDAKRDEILLSETIFFDGESKTKSYRLRGERALGDACEAMPASPELLETNLRAFLRKGAPFLGFWGSKKHGRWLGPNAIAKGCGAYPARPGRNARQALTEDLERAFAVGTRCLARVADFFSKDANPEIKARLRRDAGLLIALLRAPSATLKIRCESNRSDLAFGLSRVADALRGSDRRMRARAIPADASDRETPAIRINLSCSASFRDPWTASKIFFHESLHLLGPGQVHFDDEKVFDAIDAATECCFSEEAALAMQSPTGKIPPGANAVCKSLVTKWHGDAK